MDKESGYGYVYRKTLRLAEGRAQMLLEHSLTCTGKRALRTSVYNHNFLVLDKQPPGPDFMIRVPFPIWTLEPPNPELAEVRGNQLVYLKTLQGQDLVTTSLKGFGESAKHNEIRIENRRLGAGIKIMADRPLLKESFWSIRTVLAMEPYVAISAEQGQTVTWKSTYDYYQLAASSGGQR